jgi:exodeoxyribonuclease V alpha subunit
MEPTLEKAMDFGVFQEGEDTLLYELLFKGARYTWFDLFLLRDLRELTGYRESDFTLLVLLLLAALSEGSTCILLEEERLLPFLERYLPGKGSELKTLFHEAGERYPEALATVQDGTPEEEIPFVPILLCEGKKPRVAFQKYHLLEKRIGARLDFLTKKEGAPFDTSTVEKALGQRDLQLDPHQILGAALPLFNRLTVISGGPGTGKTTLIISMVRLLLNIGFSPDEIAIAAPTGRASSRIGNALETFMKSLEEPDLQDSLLFSLNPSTIHRLLRYSPSRGNFRRNRYNPLEQKIVILDEASMVDLVLMEALLEALPEDGRLVLIGDRNQLPSVDAGAILASLIPGEGNVYLSGQTLSSLKEIPSLKKKASELEKFGTTERSLPGSFLSLTKSYRSVSSIQRVSESFIRKERETIMSLPEIGPITQGEETFPGTSVPLDSSLLHHVDEGVWKTGLYPENDPETLLATWFYRTYLSRGSYCHTLEELGHEDITGTAHRSMEEKLNILFQSIYSGVLLIPGRGGPFGTGTVNRYCMDLMNWITGSRGSRGLGPGVPVVVGRNDYDRGLYNGDIGVVIGDKEGNNLAAFPFSEGYRFFPVESLMDIQPSFALTIHKSQGSEFDEVCILLRKDLNESLLSAELLYTAITRARKCVFISGEGDLLEQAMNRRLERMSGINI